ncbi:MAG: SDR family oxidoreductase [Atopostipes suicloacalis]|nr:SDR family oxidoreductase [Atopostipes suicloacalis]MDN6731296.1 SDR family oxidoreductase [Atopostipes suicloacalis]
MINKKILITGAGSGIGKLTALTLAKLDYYVIATTETERQAKILIEDVKALKLKMIVEKIDITDALDREKAWHFDPDILVNNAAVKEGGALVDIPEKNFRQQFETNVFATLLFTQEFARKMIRKRAGKIIFISSASGLMVNPFSGPYSSSKFALEALARTLGQELQEFSVEVATINPGPYLTGFNDREFNTWKKWEDNPNERVFHYQNIHFPFEQLEAKKAIAPIIKVILGEKRSFRNLIPKILAPAINIVNLYQWVKRSDFRLGKRHSLVERAYYIKKGSQGDYML